MLSQRRRQAMAQGRDAALKARIAGHPAPTNPYRPDTVAGRYFARGAHQAGQLFDQIMEIGR